MKEIIKKLVAIQSNLKAPKGQRNNFGNYNYRSAEDILSAAKPFLKEQGCTVTLCDDITMVGNRIYVKSTATLTDGEDAISTTAFAREDESKKGMDGSQVTGAASSYARKYALNGLFAIDDTKDADATNTHGKDDAVASEIEGAKDLTALEKVWNKYENLHTNQEFVSKVARRKSQLEKCA